MVWPLTWVVIIGTLPGVLIGAILRIQVIPDPGRFKLFVGVVLLYIGVRMLKALYEKKGSGNSQSLSENEFQNLANGKKKNGTNMLPKVQVKRVSFLSIEYEFHGRNFKVSIAAVMALSFFVGIIGGAYGIGGGSIIAPFFITFLKLPVYTVAGAALMGTFVTSAAGVLFYQFIAPLYPHTSVAPDWLLGFLFGIGGFGGMYLGAGLQKFVSARIIKWILLVCILVTAVKYIVTFLFF
jgi:uncharacterized membrane protein YfcA